MTQSIQVEWVDEIPGPNRPSPYDEIANQVRATGKKAKIAVTKGSLHTLANRLRHRYKDLAVMARTTKATNSGQEDTYHVYIALPEDTKPATKGKSK